MDKLLLEKPHELDEERIAVFSLIDRFAKQIEDFQIEYALKCKKRDEELHDLTVSENRIIDKIDGTLRSKRAQLDAEYKEKTTESLKRIEDAKKTAKRRNEEVEKAVEFYITQKNDGFLRIKSSHESRLREFRSSVSKIAGYCDLVKDIIGTKKYREYCKNANASMLPITNRKEAVEALAKENIADQLRERIVEDTESLAKKLFGANEIKKNVGDLFCIYKRAQLAIKFMEKDFAEDQKKIKKEIDDMCRSERQSANKEKNAINSKRDETERYIKNIMDAEDQKYKQNIDTINKNHDKELQVSKKKYRADRFSTEAKWDQELRRCKQDFVKKMVELEFPPEKMNAWLKCFWNHPKSDMQYSKLKEMQKNVLLGISRVNIASWLTDDTKDAVRFVLKKYPLLFGLSAAKAKESWKKQQIILPFTISIEQGTSLCISHDEATSDRVKCMINGIGIRMMRSVDPCMMRFHLFDESGIATYSHLMSMDPSKKNHPGEPYVKSIIGGQKNVCHSNGEDIRKEIANLKISMDEVGEVIVKSTSLRDFNKKNPKRKKEYQPILMMNFPRGLDEKSVRTMIAMGRECNHFGYSMIFAQPDRAIQNIKPDFLSALDELKQEVVQMRIEDSKKGLRVLTSHSSTESKAEILLYALPNNEILEDIAQEIRKKAVVASSNIIKFSEAEEIYPKDSEKFRGSAENGMVVPIGYLEDGATFNIQFDDEEYIHTMIMGRTGSGKTNLLHVLMCNMMLRYGPEEVEMYLVDYKFGEDFRAYTEYNLPNFRCICINNDPEFVCAMLEDLYKEMGRRSDLMRGKYQKISEYNAKNPDKKIPHSVIIIDELYEVVKDSELVASRKIMSLLETFADQGRAFGIHLVICGQDLSKVEKIDSIQKQCSTKLVLQCNDDQESLIESLMGKSAISLLHSVDAIEKGAGIFRMGNSGVKIEHTVFLGSKDNATELSDTLKEIHTYYKGLNRHSMVKVMNSAISDDPNNELQMFISHGVLKDSTELELAAGVPMSLKRNLVLQPVDHVWLVGGYTDEESMKAGESFIYFSVLSLLLNKFKNGLTEKIICTNCTDERYRKAQDNEADLVKDLMTRYPQYFQYETGTNAIATIDRLLDELDDRKDGIKTSEEAIWWCLIRPEAMDDLMSDGNFIIHLKQLIREGAKYNIHVLLWNCDVKKADVFQLEKRYFHDSVCLSMSSEEMKKVYGRDDWGEVERYKAVYVNSDNSPYFRIYDIPRENWVKKLYARLDQLV